ncbi:MAG: MiaB/RimO family radical SAM methylthiotransferase [Elusimicrobia bacterium]|nr:MiaB/RimO family radical SAM methylthiotransferase [Elusimicrobiota bacterium]
MNRKISIITYGCQMNEDDSNLIMTFFKKMGFESTEDTKEADIIIINTCTVRQHAEDKLISMIGTLNNWKTKGSEKKLYVIGCAAQRLGNNLKKKFPYIDRVIGVKNYSKIKDLFYKDISDIKFIENYDNMEQRVWDYYTITRGCNLRCSYCIVPEVRGKEKSVEFHKIIDDIRTKAKNGLREIILLGQTVNSYRDPVKNYDFTDLIKAISEIEEIKIIRFMSPHPSFFNKKFFDEYRRNLKISRWLHIPLQSGSDKMLKKMRRGYDLKRFEEIIDELRKIDKKTSITSDVIVGYSGEDEDDFNMTLDAVRRLRFSMVYCFKYSPRFKGIDPLTISYLELKKRHALILKEIKEIAKDIIKKKVGDLDDFLLYEKNYGRTNTGFNCCIINSEVQDNAKRNFKKDYDKNFFKVKIEKTEKNMLYGRVYE